MCVGEVGGDSVQAVPAPLQHETSCRGCQCPWWVAPGDPGPGGLSGAADAAGGSDLSSGHPLLRMLKDYLTQA